MQFGLLYEIALPRQLEAAGKTEYDAYWEAIEQIELAEKLASITTWPWSSTARRLTKRPSRLRLFAEKVMPNFA
jgi:hypothetical protein